MPKMEEIKENLHLNSSFLGFIKVKYAGFVDLKTNNPDGVFTFYKPENGLFWCKYACFWYNSGYFPGYLG